MIIRIISYSVGPSFGLWGRTRCGVFGMHGGMTALRFASVIIVAVLSACATWFVPESRNRGHIFDEASRGVIPADLQDIRLRIYDGLHRAHPPGGTLLDLTEYIGRAGGHCAKSDRGWAKPGFERTACRFENEIYFTRQLVILGEPTYCLTRNDWTVFVAHSEGVLGWYTVEGQATTEQLSQEDYIKGLNRQRAEEELARTTD